MNSIRTSLYFKKFEEGSKIRSPERVLFDLFLDLIKETREIIKERRPYFRSEYSNIIKSQINKGTKLIQLVNKSKYFKDRTPINEMAFENLIRNKLPDLYKYTQKYY